MTLDTRKYKLIEMITGLEDEELLAKMEKLLKSGDEGDRVLLKMVSPVKKHLDLDELNKEKNYKNPTQEEIDAIMIEADIQEPIEDLLKMI